MQRSTALVFIAVALTLAACGPAPRAPSAADARAPAGQPGRSLVAVVRVEPSTLAVRPLGEAGVALYLSRRIFNAELALLDDRAQARPYLAEALPQLNTENWRVFPDGRMETTWRLKPNLSWHDGTLLSAQDFVLSWRVYSSPELGFSGSPPWSAIEEVVAPDERTLTIRWHRPYPDAGSMTARERELPALPRHILQAHFEEQIDTFPNHLYWTREYVGLGPYRLDRWEPGAFIEAASFEGHVLGRAKIPRLKLIFSSDANAALAAMLAGEAHLAADTSLRLEQVTTLRQEWGPREAGTILPHANQWRAVVFQLRPDLATPRAILDPRVRKALAHTIDKRAINEALYHGDGIPADFIVPTTSQLGGALEGAMIRYPHEARRAEQLMAEAGFTKGGDGFYTTGPGVRFGIDIRTNAAPDNEAEMAIMASGWRQAGFDVHEVVTPAALAQNAEVRATFPGMYSNNTNAGEASLISQTTGNIPRAENRWRGGNRGGWSNPDYDRLVEVFNTTLDQGERVRLVAQMARTFTEDLPAISLFFRTQPWAYVAALRGLPSAVAPEANVAWNVHEWEFQ